MANILLCMLAIGVALQDTALSLILTTNFLIFSANDLVVSEQKDYQSYSSLSFFYLSPSSCSVYKIFFSLLSSDLDNK